MNVKRWISSWGEDYDRSSHTACAVVMLERSFLEQENQALVRLDQEVATLAQAIADALDGDALHLRTPTLVNGCSAGEVGSALTLLFEGALGNAGTTLVKTLDAPALEILVSPVEREVRAALSVIDDETGNRKGAGTLRLDQALFTVDDLGSRKCAYDQSLGLVNGQRPGEHELRVELSLGTQETVFCHGATVSPSITVSREAYAQVYSLDASGQGYLVWPLEAAWRRLDPRGSLKLDTLRVAYADAMEDERLLVVATEDPESSVSSQWQAPCAISSSMAAPAFGPGAAVHAASFQVRAPGTGLCVDEQIPSSTINADSLPRCGTGSGQRRSP